MEMRVYRFDKTLIPFIIHEVETGWACAYRAFCAANKGMNPEITARGPPNWAD
jgi:hypothetical protein